MSLEAGLAAELRRTWERSDALFALIPNDALSHRPIHLRHPFLFYLGHLPAFAWNQIGRGALGLGHQDPTLDLLFERGIDPEDAAVAEARSIRSWPSVAETLAYRDRVRERVLALIPDVLARPEDVLCARGRVLQLVVEHELMHHETLLYMVAECPTGMITRPDSVPAPEGGEGAPSEPILVPGGRVRLGVALDAVDFAWDNELGHLDVDVEDLLLDRLPVSNRAWADLLRARGEPEDLWPQSWVQRDASRAVRTVFGPVPFEVAEGWPVQVSGEQARVFCADRGGRLATEAELRRAAYSSPDGGPRAWPWGGEAPTESKANLGFRRYFPRPIGRSPDGASAWGVEELVGNGLEWTGTAFGPLPGFQAWARTYPGYSADFFDGAHDVVFGASWATDDRLARPSFRNWYRRNYPFPFTSFRVARSV